MNILSTHHVALITPNFAQMREFYTNQLKLQVVGGFPNYHILFLAAGSTMIELIEETDGARGTLGWAHLAFEVADVDAAYNELAAQGMVFHIPPEDFPPTAPTVRIAFFKDPDGNDIELLQVL